MSIAAIDEVPVWTVPEFTLNHRLALAREQAKVSQDQMAAMLGCSRRSIVRYERAGADVPRAVLLGYHVACRVDLGWLESNAPGKGQYTPRDSNPEPTDYGIDNVVPIDWAPSLRFPLTGGSAA